MPRRSPDLWLDLNATGSVADHGGLGGLADDDHTQYLLASGARDIAGDLLPDGDGTRDLGNTTDRFAEAHVDAVFTDAIDDAGGAAGVGFVVGGFPSTDSALDFGKSGKTWQHLWAEGIQFPATQVASADANNLDDYEENTWTPVLTFATPGNLSVVYSAQFGNYTKIGRMVFWSARITTTTFTHTTASGSARITGLPFTASGADGVNQFPGASFFGGWTAANKIPVWYASQGQTYLECSLVQSGTALASLTTAEMPTGGTVVIAASGSYFV
jgi:hypothetical protein